MSKPTATKSTKTPDNEFDSSHLFEHFMVTIRFRDKVIGGFPQNKKLIESWVKAAIPVDDAQRAKMIEDQKASVESYSDKVSEATDATWTVFPRDDHGLYLETRQIKAGLRECFVLLRHFPAHPGSKQIFQHAMFVDGERVNGRTALDRIYLGRKEPDGCVERPIHVQTAQGERDALKRTDYVERAEITFGVRILKTNPVDKRHLGGDALKEALKLLQDNGLGADRSQGQGTFDVVGFLKLD